MTLSLIVTEAEILNVDGKPLRCAVGRAGFIPADDKREGDLKTPIGQFLLREIWYRADRLALPDTLLPTRVITRLDGWCDDPASPDYNKAITLPSVVSHETLWRDDHAYDIVIPLGYNDAPAIPRMGSAIFFHLAQPDYRGTEGCVAIAQEAMLALIPNLSPSTQLTIAPANWLAV